MTVAGGTDSHRQAGRQAACSTPELPRGRRTSSANPTMVFDHLQLSQAATFQ